MILKITGIILIMISTSLAGYSMALQGIYRAEELGLLSRAFALLKNEICYLSMPLPQALAELALKTKGAVGDIFRIAADKMEQRQGESAEELWRQAIEMQQIKLYLKAEDYDALLSFGKTLGYLDKEQQKVSIEMLMHYLKDTETQLREKSRVNHRLYCSMGVITGLLLVVVLI